jgi:hypothetical protein
MTDVIEGKTVTTDLDAGTQAVTDTQPQPRKVLNPVTLKVIERSIQEVLSDYVKQSKQFTADSMHAIRQRVTEMVKQRLGEDEIETVDIGLDLTNVGEIPFFFKVNVPESKSANHFIDAPDAGPTAPFAPEPEQVQRCGDGCSVEEFRKIVESEK